MPIPHGPTYTSIPLHRIIIAGYKTTDGGTNWVQQFAIQNGTTSFPNNVYFWNASEGMFQGDVKDGYFEIYITSDGGTTWIRVPQANINAIVQPGGEYGLLRAFTTVGDSMICFITTKGNIYVSHDRGYHWTGNTLGYTMTPNYYYSYIAFHDINHGLVGYGSSAVTSMILRETSDGGTTWAVANTTGPVNCFGLAAVPGSPGTYVSTGQNASMMDGKMGLTHTDDTSAGTMMVNSGVTYSFDGGHTWKKMASTDAKHFLALKWLNDSVAFAGSWNNNAVNDGMYKFTSSLAEADFAASDSMISVGDQVNFSITSGGHSTSTFNWTFDGGSPASSTSRNPVVTYNTKGVFNVTLSVTNTWGNSTKLKTSYIYAGCGVGIENHPSGSVSVFTNPANNLLTIKGNAPILKVLLCNLTGKEILSGNFNNSQASIQTSGLNIGMYNLIIQLQNETVSRKIIIK